MHTSAAFLELEVAGAVAGGLAQEGDTHGRRARVLGLSLQVLGWWLWLTPLFVLYRVCWVIHFSDMRFNNARF